RRILEQHARHRPQELRAGLGGDDVQERRHPRASPSRACASAPQEARGRARALLRATAIEERPDETGMMDLEAKPAERGPAADRFPRNLVEFIWRMSGWRQVALCVFSAFIAAVNFLPVELQRRLVDDAITPGRFDLLTILGAI